MSSAVESAKAVADKRAAEKKAANPARAARREVASRFDFHPATEKTGPLHEEIRAKHKRLALYVQGLEGESREKSLALTKLQEAMMFANAHVAIHLGKD